MKLQGRGVDQFLARPDPSIRAVLLYGPEQGLLAERSAQILRKLYPDLTDFQDPFRVTILNGDVLESDPGRLRDEACTLSLMGDARIVIVREADDGAAIAVQNYLEHADGKSFVLIEAGELTPRSALRKLCEDHAKAAALPCYVEDENAVAQYIRARLQQEGYTITPDALSMLAPRLVGDRRMANNEIEKLLLYVGQNKSVDMEDVLASSVDAAELELDQLVFALGDHDAPRLLRVLDRLYGEGMASIAMIRACLRHFNRLHLTKARIEQGMPPVQAVKQLQPPVFFKQEPAFLNQAQRHSLTSLSKILAHCHRLEELCKQTGFPDQIVLSQHLLRIAG